jgi:ferritin-like protein
MTDQEKPMSNEGYHEPVNSLDEATRDMHRALVSLKEELGAVDWYEQRVAATGDDELRHILAHNRDEEKEHAAMVLEWLRRRDPRLDRQLRTYLFAESEISGIEDEKAPLSEPRDGSLGIGSLREEGEQE